MYHFIGLNKTSFINLFSAFLLQKIKNAHCKMLSHIFS